MTARKNKPKREEDNRAEQQAKAQLSSIRDMIEALRAAREAEDDSAIEAAEQSIQEDPLSVQVRGDWHTPGELDTSSAEFEILLCTGGPACRLIGELGQYNEPDSIEIQYQDWGTPWTTLPTSGEDDEIMLEYCRCFYFGD